ncbi:hypothetical protein R6Q59_032755 [Mikania micrantha]
MDESKSSDKEAEAPNVVKRGNDEMETVVHHENLPPHSRETHGIDVNTPNRDVKGPKVFGRLKEEFEAIVEAIHQRKEDKNRDSSSNVKSLSDDATITRTKLEKQSSLADRRGSPRHNKETHGRGEDIDADTPISEFKGPNIFHRAKEEIEAIVDTIHSKREADRYAASPKKQSAFADHWGSPRHYKETHGRGEEIDADTPISEFKGPNIFHRAKEEFEAIVDTIQSKRESDRDAASPKKQSSLADHSSSPSGHNETHGRRDDIDADMPFSEFKGPNIFHRAKEEVEAIVDKIQSKKESDHDAASPKKDGFRASISKKLQKTRNRD